MFVVSIVHHTIVFKDLTHTVMEKSSLELHKRINARLYARQCWPVNVTPVVKLYKVTITREGYLDGYIIGERGNATFSFHGFTK